MEFSKRFCDMCGAEIPAGAFVYNLIIDNAYCDICCDCRDKITNEVKDMQKKLKEKMGV